MFNSQFPILIRGDGASAWWGELRLRSSERKSSMRVRILCVLVFVCFSAITLSAQNNASLSGTVQDTTGAIVPGATVKLTSHEQGTVRTYLSNEASVYQFSFLPAGVYDIEA